MTLWSRLAGWLGRVFGRRRTAPIGLLVVEGDELPAQLPKRTLVVAREDGVDWVAGMLCPCGCDRRIELMLLAGVKPRWRTEVDQAGLPSLHPSVWVQTGCRSHFWLTHGFIRWCRDD